MRADQVSAAFGRVLREQRTAAGVSQEALALSADVDRTFVSQIERGAARLDTSTMAAYLHAIGGELTITATVGNLSVRL